MNKFKTFLVAAETALTLTAVSPAFSPAKAQKLIRKDPVVVQIEESRLIRLKLDSAELNMYKSVEGTQRVLIFFTGAVAGFLVTSVGMGLWFSKKKRDRGKEQS